MRRRKFFLGLLATCALIPVLTVSAQDGPPKPSTEPVTGSWYAIGYFYKAGYPDVIVKSSKCKDAETAMSCVYNSDPPPGDFYLYSVDVFPSSNPPDISCTGQVISSFLDEGKEAITVKKDRDWEKSKWQIVVDVEAEKGGKKNRKRKKNQFNASSFRIFKANILDYRDEALEPEPTVTKTIRSLHLSREPK